jgi:hypothetical protein
MLKIKDLEDAEGSIYSSSSSGHLDVYCGC